METITKAAVPSVQIDQLEQLSEGTPVELREVLQALVACLREGDEVVAFDADDALTPNQAAKRLRMSRTHLYKLLDNEVLPSHRVGRDRRILMRDLLVFASHRHAERHALAERFASQQQAENAAARELAELL